MRPYHVSLPGQEPIRRSQSKSTLETSIDIRHATPRHYSRRSMAYVMRAVIDELSKRFVVSGQQELQRLTTRLQSVDQSMDATRLKVVPDTGSRWTVEAAKEVVKNLSKRCVKARDLEKDARSFLPRVDIRHKPSHKLYEAVRHAATKQVDHSDQLSDDMTRLGLASGNVPNRGDPDQLDQRVTLGGKLYHLKVRQLILNGKFSLLRAYKTRTGRTDLEFHGGSPVARSHDFFHDCENLIKSCKIVNTPKLAVEATLRHAQITFQLGAPGANADSGLGKVIQYREMAMALLDEAHKLCENAFQDRNALKQTTGNVLKMLGSEFYEEVTKEEIEAVKRAMVSGRGGIATHTGHWYNCVDGHPVNLHS